jgi:hypothetical protein
MANGQQPAAPLPFIYDFRYCASYRLHCYRNHRYYMSYANCCRYCMSCCRYCMSCYHYYMNYASYRYYKNCYHCYTNCASYRSKRKSYGS